MLMLMKQQQLQQGALTLDCLEVIDYSFCLSGECRNGALLHLHVKATSQARRHSRARRGGGVRVSTREQQKLNVLRAAVLKGRTSQGEILVCDCMWKKQQLSVVFRIFFCIMNSKSRFSLIQI